MPSLERFFDPQMRPFSQNITTLPGARLYFFESGTTTPKSIFLDKQGLTAASNPVIADSNGIFPQLFLDGLYRVELRSTSNIVQPGWPIDNIGQDNVIVPFGPWSDIVSYNEGEIVTGSNGNWYRSSEDNNLGNDPTSSPGEWEVIPIPVASSFTSDAAYLTWSDDGDQISLDVDESLMKTTLAIPTWETFTANVAYFTWSDDSGDISIDVNETLMKTTLAIPTWETFTSNVAYFSWSDDSDDISLDVNETLLKSTLLIQNAAAVAPTYTPEYSAAVGLEPFKAEVKSGILFLNGWFTSSGSSDTVIVGTLAAGYRPLTKKWFHVSVFTTASIDLTAPDLQMCSIGTDGTLSISGFDSDKTYCISASVTLS